MTTLVSAAATIGPLTAGWSATTVWMRQRLTSARRDPLTGLWTRAEFTCRATRLLRRTPVAAVLVLDLNEFKAINDRFGHAAGDTVLAFVAERLERWRVPAGRVIGRLGGDEFAVVVALDSASDLPFLLHGLHQELTAPAPFEDGYVPVGVSIGSVCTLELPAPGLPAALRSADEAMYAAKGAGLGWHIASGPDPVMATVNGRRAGRDGTHHSADGGAR